MAMYVFIASLVSVWFFPVTGNHESQDRSLILPLPYNPLMDDLSPAAGRGGFDTNLKITSSSGSLSGIRFIPERQAPVRSQTEMGKDLGGTCRVIAPFVSVQSIVVGAGSLRGLQKLFPARLR
ncbi:hypothetical protein Bbelb_001350 [Branchiostoma belcheri]|nr:hypothetical protein Bbelb_001350 [Branchiostoma belcheri]